MLREMVPQDGNGLQILAKNLTGKQLKVLVETFHRDDKKKEIE